MVYYFQINKLVNSALKEKRLLTPTETITLLSNLEKISEDDALIENLTSHILYLRDKTGSHQSLTKRELQILKLIGFNFKSAEISKTLSISNNTVATHRKNIIKKLGIKGTRQLKVFATEHVKAKIN